MTYTVGYFCYLCNDKNETVKQKNALLDEAKTWKAYKHLGKADVCFEQYEIMKASIAGKTAHIKEVGKRLLAKPVYADDYSICGIEMRVNGSYVTIARNYEQIKEQAEQYIVESIILGNFDDKPQT